ncbi:MAG: acyl-CoA synthetase [bacterium]
MGGDAYLQIPERINMAWQALDRWVEEGRGAETAIHWMDEGKEISWAALQEAANRWGNALSGLGLARGDRFVIRLPNRPEFCAAFLGAQKMGAVPIPSSPMQGPRELEFTFQESGAVLALGTAETLAPVAALREKLPALKHMVALDPAGADGALGYAALTGAASPELAAADTGRDELAFILYTSGTTGHPKGVAHGHRWLQGTGAPIAESMMRLGAGDIVYQPQEYSFVYALGCGFLYPFLAGAAVVQTTRRPRPEEAWGVIERCGVTVFCTVPTFFRMMLAAPEAEKKRDFSRLRHSISAGETLPAETFRAWMDLTGSPILDGIGQTEFHIFVANTPEMEIRPGSMGKPLPGYEAAILDPEGNPQPDGEVGHLCVRDDHPGLFFEYRSNPEKWAEVMQHGHYYIGDLAYRDSDGYYWYVSRSDDIIKSRGYLISPKEMEDTLLEHPVVLESGVVGVPDAETGNLVKAYVVLHPGHAPSRETADALRSHVRGRIAPYKAPKAIEFLDELPKNMNGKILRRELRARAVRDSGAGEEKEFRY